MMKPSYETPAYVEYRILHLTNLGQNRYGIAVKLIGSVMFDLQPEVRDMLLARIESLMELAIKENQDAKR